MKRHLEEPAVNLTPLIDVVFIILILFIFIAPLLEVDRIELADAPSQREETMAEKQEVSPISIHVRSDNSIWLNKQKVEPSQLVSLLMEAKAKYPQARPQLFQDKKGEFGTYQTVKNAAEQAGFSSLDIILKP